MHDPFPPPTDPLDAVVRAALDAEAAAHEAAPLLAQLRLRLQTTPVQAVPARPLRRRAAVLVALAAALFLAVWLGLPRNQVQASPAELLHAARQTQAVEIDRCYRLTVDAGPELRKRLPQLTWPQENRLWTRGDRFLVQPVSASKGVWGMDERGRVWFAPTPELGLRYETDEVPDCIQTLLNVRTVRWQAVLDEVLADCALTWATADQADGPRRRRIRAVPKVAGTLPFHLVEAELEVDEESKVIHQLRLRRARFGRDGLTLTLALLETVPQPDRRYRLEGHVQPEASILNRAQPLPRGRALLQSLSGLLAPVLDPDKP